MRRIPLTPELILKIQELREKPLHPDIVRLTEDIEAETTALELACISNESKVLLSARVSKIEHMKLRLVDLYADWALGLLR